MFILIPFVVMFYQVYGATSGDGLLESQVFVNSIQFEELTTQNQIKLLVLRFKLFLNEDAEDYLEYERYSVGFSYSVKDLMLEKDYLFARGLCILFNL